MSYTDAQQWTLAIVPKITGLISFIFSALVVYTVIIVSEKENKVVARGENQTEIR